MLRRGFDQLYPIDCLDYGWADCAFDCCLGTYHRLFMVIRRNVKIFTFSCSFRPAHVMPSCCWCVFEGHLLLFFLCTISIMSSTIMQERMSSNTFPSWSFRLVVLRLVYVWLVMFWLMLMPVIICSYLGLWYVGVTSP